MRGDNFLAKIEASVILFMLAGLSHAARGGWIGKRLRHSDESLRAKDFLFGFAATH
jgi:hypothetical protein